MGDTLDVFLVLFSCILYNARGAAEVHISLESDEGELISYAGERLVDCVQLHLVLLDDRSTSTIVEIHFDNALKSPALEIMVAQLLEHVLVVVSEIFEYTGFLLKLLTLRLDILLRKIR